MLWFGEKSISYIHTYYSKPELSFDILLPAEDPDWFPVPDLPRGVLSDVFLASQVEVEDFVDFWPIFRTEKENKIKIREIQMQN